MWNKIVNFHKSNFLRIRHISHLSALQLCSFAVSGIPGTYWPHIFSVQTLSQNICRICCKELTGRLDVDFSLADFTDSRMCKFAIFSCVPAWSVFSPVWGNIFLLRGGPTLLHYWYAGPGPCYVFPRISRPARAASSVSVTPPYCVVVRFTQSIVIWLSFILKFIQLGTKN